MPTPAHDQGADALLHLDGQVFVVDPKGDYWVRLVVRRVESSPERPHGLNYSLTRTVRVACGHGHRMDAVRPCRFKDAGTLIEDFWAEVDRSLKEKGVL